MVKKILAGAAQNEDGPPAAAQKNKMKMAILLLPMMKMALLLLPMMRVALLLLLKKKMALLLQPKIKMALVLLSKTKMGPLLLPNMKDVFLVLPKINLLSPSGRMLRLRQMGAEKLMCYKYFLDILKILHFRIEVLLRR